MNIPVLPHIAIVCRTSWAARKCAAKFGRHDKAGFAAVLSESVDYAVMERCPGSFHVVRLAAGWNDLGAWDAVWQVAEKDTDGNAAVGDALLSENRSAYIPLRLANPGKVLPESIEVQSDSCLDEDDIVRFEGT